MTVPPISFSGTKQADAIGRVVSAEGPILEVQFDPAQTPSLFNALTLTGPLHSDVGTAAVVQSLTNGKVRCISLTPQVRYVNGWDAIDTGAPALQPADDTSVREMVDLLGKYHIAESVMLETGMKAVDLLCPIPVRGHVGLFAEWGLSAPILVAEILQHLEGRPGSLSLITLLQLRPDTPRWKESVAEMVTAAGEQQALYLPVSEPNSPTFQAQFTRLDAVISLSREYAKQGFYPPIDPYLSHSRLLEMRSVSWDHTETAAAVRQILERYRAFGPVIANSGMEALSPADRLLASRARKIQRFLTQPFFVAEPYTGMAGKWVPCQETILGCKALLEGVYDSFPEQAFYMIGAIEEAAAKLSA